MKRGKELFFTEHWYNERNFSPAFCFGDVFEHKTTSERVVLKSFEPIHKVIVGCWKDLNVEKVIDFYDLKENYTNVGSVLDKTDLLTETFPLKASRFVLDFGIEGLDYRRVKSVSYSEGHICVRVMETENLYHPEFFQNNKFENRIVKLSFLSRTGVKVMETTFSGVTFKKYETDSFDYDADSDMMTNLFFTYKEVEHHTICHSRQEEKEHQR